MKKIIGILAVLITISLGCSKSDNTTVEPTLTNCFPDNCIKKYDNINNTSAREINANTGVAIAGDNVVFELKKYSCKEAVFTYYYTKIISAGVVYEASGSMTINKLELVDGNDYVGRLSDGRSVTLQLPTIVPTANKKMVIEYKEGDIIYTFSGY
jgi:hypothetical protein